MKRLRELQLEAFLAACMTCIDEIARNLDGLVPRWLPRYDLRAYAAKVDNECGYTSDTMVGTEIDTKLFEEIVAFVQLCGAFGRLHPSDARQYACVRDDRGEIDDVLARNATHACPTYAGLLALLIERGILVQRAQNPASPR